MWACLAHMFSLCSPDVFLYCCEIMARMRGSGHSVLRIAVGEGLDAKLSHLTI